MSLVVFVPSDMVDGNREMMKRRMTDVIWWERITRVDRRVKARGSLS